MIKQLDSVFTRPSYIEKLRTYFKLVAPHMIRNYQKTYNSQKGCWVTTILPSLLDRQLRMSSGNLSNSSMIESEFIPLNKVGNQDLYKFLESLEITRDNLPLVIINSVSTVDGYHLILIGDSENKVYTIDSL